MVEKPVTYRMQGSIVRIEVTTADEVLQFAMSASHFLAGFGRAAIVAREWRGGDVVGLERATG